jgi:hypothetical protein
MSSAKCCPLAGLFFPVGTALQSLGLAVMIGGMLALGAFTAPAVFGGLPREMAAPVMARIFSRFDDVVLAAMITAQLGEFLRWLSRTVSMKSRLNILRLGLLGLLTVSVIYSTQMLNPNIEKMNMAGVHRHQSTAASARFDDLHKLSEKLYKLELLTAVLLLVLIPFVRTTGAGAKAEACGVSSEVTESPKKDCCP